MLDTYFFVPADKAKYIEKMPTLDADFFVLDLEESVSPSSKAEALDNVLALPVTDKHFCRVHYPDISDADFARIAEHFGGRVIIPKIGTSKEFDRLVATHGDVLNGVIILVEKPILFFELPAILDKYASRIKGIGFGSHDFCALMGMRHTLEQLSAYRKQLILAARTFGVDYIDGVDLNIRDHAQLREECKYVFDAGATGKFAIHPGQLSAIDSVAYLSVEEQEQLLAVHEKLVNIPTEELDVIELNGKVYEKPHLTQIRNLVKKIQRVNAKNKSV